MHTLVLASRSPRRVSLLTDAGFTVLPRPADLDDGDLAPPARPPEHWVAALAYLKARRVAESAGPHEVVLGADTVVIKRGVIIGQPRDEADAARMIRLLREGTHTVATGVAILAPAAHRRLLVDRVRVEVGPVTDSEIDAYVASGAWRGKAGAYNLADRQAAGWPLTPAGDPTTVMGLPMALLTPILDELSITPRFADTPSARKGAP